MTTRVDIGYDPRKPYVSGDDYSLEIEVVNDEDGTLQNLSGALCTFSLFDKDPDTGALIAQLFTKTVGSGILLTDPTNGLLTIFITGTNTAALRGDYYHELKIQIGGVVQRAMFGTLRVRADAIT